ncbi:PREDICTED: uncharacterized protein LOC104716885 [Camelina sativa]|uniref:Uncharacterized protein LOC104716885 n=1 Tax=Camelina sativa TaxID=90675 RepID=A0ABM0TWY7_CAMSA|nr:PREDICTED: uncharacterized protein LOC104716885 [Camelina sativa]
MTAKLHLRSSVVLNVMENDVILGGHVHPGSRIIIRRRLCRIGTWLWPTTRLTLQSSAEERLMGKGHVLSEEERAKESMYIQSSHVGLAKKHSLHVSKRYCTSQVVGRRKVRTSRASLMKKFRKEFMKIQKDISEIQDGLHKIFESFFFSWTNFFLDKQIFESL